MAPIPSIHLQSMQAESMVQAAISGGKNFSRAAKAFFRTTNEAYPTEIVNGKIVLAPIAKNQPNGLSNAIVALFSALNNAEKEASKINRTDSIRTKLNKLFGNKKSVKEIFAEAFEKSAKKDEELKTEALELFVKFKKAHPDSWLDRLIAARAGLVRAEEIHKPTKMERLNAFLNKLIAEE